MRFLNLSIFSIVLLLCFIFSSRGNAESNMLFILDASGSMWGQVDGTAKIETAKNVLGTLLKDLPADTKVGLMTYGHREEGDCKDVETLSSIGSDDLATVKDKLYSIVPKGKTPISYSLTQTISEFKNISGENNYVVLISDGIETCEGDPCDAASEVVAAGINIKVHVVGFDVSDEARKQLQCIADNGDGKYFNASNTEDFKNAIAQVKEEVKVVEPDPTPTPKQELKEYFFDDFDGAELKEVWEINNPDPDNFIVEDGVLMVISSTGGDLSAENVPNVFRLGKPMPDGDWILTAKALMVPQTGYELFFTGIYDDKENYIIASYSTRMRGADYHLYFDAKKMSNGKPSSFRKVHTKLKLWNDEAKENFRSTYSIPIYLRLRREGRNYTVSYKFEGMDPEGNEYQWTELEKLTSLRAKGNLVVGIHQQQQTPGETSVKVDWIKIETL